MRNGSEFDVNREQADEEVDMVVDSKAVRPSPLSRRTSISERISSDLGLEETHKNYDKKFGRIGVFKHRPF
jgi:hypothetical protein